MDNSFFFVLFLLVCLLACFFGGGGGFAFALHSTLLTVIARKLSGRPNKMLQLATSQYSRAQGDCEKETVWDEIKKLHGDRQLNKTSGRVVV